MEIAFIECLPKWNARTQVSVESIWDALQLVH